MTRCAIQHVNVLGIFCVFQVPFHHSVPIIRRIRFQSAFLVV